MASCKCYLFVNFFLLCLFFQIHIPISAGENCLNPTFKKDEKLEIAYFFNYEVADIKLSPVICPLVLLYKEQFSFVSYMCDGSIDKKTCSQNIKCVRNRMQACYYKDKPNEYNKCNEYRQPMVMSIADCVCSGGGDDILASNDALRLKYGIQTFPALVLNKKYDPCFKDYTINGIESYLCKAYQNALPFCKK